MAHAGADRGAHVSAPPRRGSSRRLHHRAAPALCAHRRGSAAPASLGDTCASAMREE